MLVDWGLVNFGYGAAAQSPAGQGRNAGEHQEPRGWFRDGALMMAIVVVFAIVIMMTAPAAFAFIFPPNVFRGPGDISAEAFVFVAEANGTQPRVLARSSRPPSNREGNGGGSETQK